MFSKAVFTSAMCHCQNAKDGDSDSIPFVKSPDPTRGARL